MIFQNRKHAGEILSSHLSAYKGKENAIVLGLARGGVVVAHEIAKELSLPLNVLVPRKLGAPENPEFAIGAVAENGEVFLNPDAALSHALLKEEVEKKKQEAQEILSRYRKSFPLETLKGKTVLLVDDGIATGSTFLAEIQSLKKQGVGSIVAAVPVAAVDAWQKIKALVDEAVCPSVEEDLQGISRFYQEFSQVTDEIVFSILRRH